MYEMILIGMRSGMVGKKVKIGADANILKLVKMENAKIEKHVADKSFCTFCNFAHLEIYWKEGTK